MCTFVTQWPMDEGRARKSAGCRKPVGGLDLLHFTEKRRYRHSVHQGYRQTLSQIKLRMTGKCGRMTSLSGKLPLHKLNFSKNQTVNEKGREVLK